MAEASLSWSSMSSTSPSTQPESSLSRLPTKMLVTPRRVDLAVKHAFFQHLLHGGDEDAVRIYRWHIDRRCGPRFARGLPMDVWKWSVDDYVAAAGALCASMANRGFIPECAVPVDPDGDLLGGAHRVACALALGIDEIPVVRKEQRAWAPPWGYEWFRANGMAREDLERVSRDWSALRRVQSEAVRKQSASPGPVEFGELVYRHLRSKPDKSARQ